MMPGAGIQESNVITGTVGEVRALSQTLSFVHYSGSRQSKCINVDGSGKDEDGIVPLLLPYDTPH